MSMESIKYTVTGFCRCFAFRIGKIRGHNGIIWNFQFRKFLPVYSSTDTSALKRKEIVNISFLSDNICIDYNKTRYKKQRYIIL